MDFYVQFSIPVASSIQLSKYWFCYKEVNTLESKLKNWKRNWMDFIMSHIVEVCCPFDNSDICLILSCEFHFSYRKVIYLELLLPPSPSHLLTHFLHKEGSNFLLCGENGSVPWTWPNNACSRTAGDLVCCLGIGRRTFNNKWKNSYTNRRRKLKVIVCIRNECALLKFLSQICSCQINLHR